MAAPQDRFWANRGSLAEVPSTTRQPRLAPYLFFKVPLDSSILATKKSGSQLRLGDQLENLYWYFEQTWKKTGTLMFFYKLENHPVQIYFFYF